MSEVPQIPEGLDLVRTYQSSLSSLLTELESQAEPFINESLEARLAESIRNLEKRAVAIALEHLQIVEIALQGGNSTHDDALQDYISRLADHKEISGLGISSTFPLLPISIQEVDSSQLTLQYNEELIREMKRIVLEFTINRLLITSFTVPFYENILAMEQAIHIVSLDNLAQVPAQLRNYENSIHIRQFLRILNEINQITGTTISQSTNPQTDDCIINIYNGSVATRITATELYLQDAA